METEKKPRKTYTREFKVEAVRLTTEGGIKVAQAARDLGINENTLHIWRRQFRQWGAGPTAGKGDLTLDCPRFVGHFLKRHWPVSRSRLG